jgi:hypothetical protein
VTANGNFFGPFRKGTIRVTPGKQEENTENTGDKRYPHLMFQ